MRCAQRRFLLATLVLATLAVAGCGDRAVGGGDGGPGDGGSEAGLSGCDRICAADFPCRGSASSYCASAAAVQHCRTIPCEEVCGTTCCMGASCGPSDTTPCEAGLRCFERATDGGSYEGPRAECKPPRDAGVDASYAGWVEGTGGSFCY